MHHLQMDKGCQETAISLVPRLSFCRLQYDVKKAGKAGDKANVRYEIDSVVTVAHSQIGNGLCRLCRTIWWHSLKGYQIVLHICT